MYQEIRNVVTIDEWTDRIYQCTPQELMITNVVSGRKMRIFKYNLPDTGEADIMSHLFPNLSLSFVISFDGKIICGVILWRKILPPLIIVDFEWTVRYSWLSVGSI